VQSTPHYRISNDRAQLDVAMIHQFLSQESYVGADRAALSVVAAGSIAQSLCFGMYQADRQIGFARVVTDAATFGLSGRRVHRPIASRQRGLGQAPDGRRWWRTRICRDCTPIHAGDARCARAIPAVRLYRRRRITQELLMERHEPQIYQAQPTEG
jgi:hypothetical protein